MTTRRQFLSTAVRTPAVVALGSLVPSFLLRAAEQNDGRDADRILVVVQLTGGNDGLNTVVPFTNDLYRKARKTLAVPASDVLKIDRELGLHPSLRGFADLLEADRLAIVQGVGYPNPNRSHFESMDIWHTCHRKDVLRPDGWLGRYLDTSAADIPAIHLGQEKQPLALAARNVRVPSVRSLEQFRLQTGGDVTRDSVSALAVSQREGGDDLLGFVQSSTTSALSVSDRFRQAGASVEPAAAYPKSELGRKLGTIARLIAAGLSTRIYYVEIDGFDTHSQQAAAHAGLLRQVGDAVSAFVGDLAGHGDGDRVLVMCFSEFGRQRRDRPRRGGTDVPRRHEGPPRPDRQAPEPDRPRRGGSQAPHRLPAGLRGGAAGLAAVRQRARAGGEVYADRRRQGVRADGHNGHAARRPRSGFRPRASGESRSVTIRGKPVASLAFGG
jgi:uncharacterized protein (DUF1501 family)